MAKPDEPALIAVDWGTTNRRSYLIDGDGNVLDSRVDGLGLMNVQDLFAQSFASLAAPWTALHGPLPALLSGMVGAKTGWHEAPYCELPAGLADLAENLARAPSGGPVWIVPGVKTEDEGGVPDVMRGEEIQAIAAAGVDDCLVVLPGTHSKWVRMEGGRIVDFTTFMTGDLRSAILGHTVLRKDGRGPPRTRNAYLQGVDTGYTRHKELTHILFGARSRDLFGEISDGDVPDYLTGLLIGAELAHALTLYAARTVRLVSGVFYRRPYCDALVRFGVDVVAAESGALARTYRDLAVQADIIDHFRA